MAEYKSRILITVSSNDVWKRFDNQKSAFGLDFKTIATTQANIYCLDKAWACMEGDIDQLVSNISEILVDDGFVIADTTDLDCPAYTYAVTYLGEDIHSYYFGSSSDNRYLYEKVKIINFDKWVKKVSSESFLSDTENKYLAQYGILIDNPVGTIGVEKSTEDNEDLPNVVGIENDNWIFYLAGMLDSSSKISSALTTPTKTLTINNEVANSTPQPISTNHSLEEERKMLEEEQRMAIERRRLKQEQKSDEECIQPAPQTVAVYDKKSVADEIPKLISEIERFLKYYEKSWKKDVKTTNAEILGSLPLTRSNDARIRKMITNTEGILSKYADDMIDKCHRLDEMGQEYRQGVVEDDVVIHICEILHNMVDALNMSHTLQFPKQTYTAQYTVPNELKDVPTRWKRYRSNLPSVKIQKIEEPLLQCQLSLDTWNKTLNNHKVEENSINAKIAECNDRLTKKKKDLDEAIAIEVESNKHLTRIQAVETQAIKECDAKLQKLQFDKASLDLNKAKHDLSQAATMYNSNIATTQARIDQLNIHLKEEKAEESLAQEAAEKAFLFKKKKQEIAAEITKKVIATQAELNEELTRLQNYKSQKESVVASLNSKISDIQEKISILDAQIANITENKKSAESNINRAEQDYELKVLGKKKAEKALEDEEKLLASLQRELKKNAKAISEAESEIQLLSKSIEEYCQEIAKIKEKADLTRQKAQIN